MDGIAMSVVDSVVRHLQGNYTQWGKEKHEPSTVGGTRQWWQPCPGSGPDTTAAAWQRILLGILGTT